MTSKLDSLSEDELATVSMFAGGSAVCNLLRVSQRFHQAISHQSNVIWKVLLQDKLLKTFIELRDATLVPSDNNHYKTLYGQLDLKGSIDFSAFRLKVNHVMLIDVETNNKAGNKTVSEKPARIELLNDGKFSTIVYYSAGDDYNDACVANWQGEWDDQGKVKWKEVYGSHGGLFIYDGTFNTPTSIQAQYYWDIKPTAQGTASIQLVG